MLNIIQNTRQMTRPPQTILYEQYTKGFTLISLNNQNQSSISNQPIPIRIPFTQNKAGSTGTIVFMYYAKNISVEEL